MITVSIPVKNYVKKYLVKKYGTVHTVSKKTFLGLLLLELINDDVQKPDRVLEEMDKYEIEVPEYYFNTRGFNINQNKSKFLGLCLEKLFFEDYLAFVDLELAKGKLDALKSVKLFLQLYNISENELKLESMYRKYQRYSGEKIKDKKKCVIVN